MSDPRFRATCSKVRHLLRPHCSTQHEWRPTAKHSRPQGGARTSLCTAPRSPRGSGQTGGGEGRRRIPGNQKLLPFCWAWLAHRGQLVQGPTTAVCHSCLARATGHLTASSPSGWSSPRRTVWNQEPKHSVCRWRVQHCVKKTGVQQDRAGARAPGRPVNQP